MNTTILPVWIEMAGTPLALRHQKIWPFQAGTHPATAELVQVANSYLKEITQRLTVTTTQPSGVLYLRYVPAISGYRGIFVPERFPSLNELMKYVFQSWDDTTEVFEDGIQAFFALRQQEAKLSLYQFSSDYYVKIPPIFVLNQQQINGVLLHSLRSRANSVLDISLVELDSILTNNLPEEYVTLIGTIAAEEEMTLLHLLSTYLHTHDMISYQEYTKFVALLDHISPELSDYILLNYLTTRLQQGKDLSPELRSHLGKQFDQAEGMKKIVLNRLLIELAKKHETLMTQEKYLQVLLQQAPALSWNKNLDLLNAQIGLARCSVSRGDYFRAMTFYAFARQGFNSIGSERLQEEMNDEFQRISALSAIQQLQAGLYQINHHNLDRNILLLLVDGIQSVLTHFLRYLSNFQPTEEVLPFLLQAAVTQMKIHESSFNQLFPQSLDFTGLNELAELLTNEENRLPLANQIQKQIEYLSFKDQKMIEKISIFYDDGRHIADYILTDGKFMQVTSNPNQALFSSAMSAVSMLVSEATQSDKMVDEISVGNKKIVYDRGKAISFCLICNASESNLKQLLRNVVRKVEDHYQKHLHNWSGNLGIFKDMGEFLLPLSFYTIDQKDVTDFVSGTEF